MTAAITGAAIGFLAMLPFTKRVVRRFGPVWAGSIHGLLIAVGAAIGGLIGSEA